MIMYLSFYLSIFSHFPPPLFALWEKWRVWDFWGKMELSGPQNFPKQRCNKAVLLILSSSACHPSPQEGLVLHGSFWQCSLNREENKNKSGKGLGLESSHSCMVLLEIISYSTQIVRQNSRLAFAQQFTTYSIKSSMWTSRRQWRATASGICDVNFRVLIISKEA